MTQDTLAGISQVFSTHEDTDPESDPGEKIQSIHQKQCPKSSKEDSSSKESSKSSSEEEPPTDEALCDKVRQKAQSLDTRFDAWHCEKIAEDVMGWATRDHDLQPPQTWEDTAQSLRPGGAAPGLHERVSGL